MRLVSLLMGFFIVSCSNDTAFKSSARKKGSIEEDRVNSLENEDLTQNQKNQRTSI